MKLVLDKIIERKEQLKRADYPKKDEIDYIDNLGFMIDSLYYQKNPDHFTSEELFLVCHMAYNFDDDFEELKKIVESSSLLLKDIITDLNKIKGSVFEQEKYLDTIKRLKTLYRRKKILPFASTEVLKSEFMQNEKQFESITSTIYSYYSRMIKYNNKCITNIIKEYTALKNLHNYLLNDLTLPISINKSLLENIDEEIIFELYRRTIILNQEYYYEIYNKKNKLISNEIQNKKHQLSMAGYDINQISNSTLNFILKYGDINKITKIVPFLKQIDYKMFDLYSNNGIYILVNTDYETLNIFNELLKNNIINLKFLNENPQVFFNKDILNKVEGLSSILLNNIDLLVKNYNLNDTYINDLLLKQNEELESNISLLKKYSINFNKQILNNIKLIDYLDLFIDLGLGEFIINNINIINENSMDLIKRIYVAKLLEIKVIENNSINSNVLYKDNFYVTNELINEYIINNTNDCIDSNIKQILDTQKRNNVVDNEPLELLNYKKDNLTYDFDGILISKNKVLRNLNCLIDNYYSENYNQILLASIIYGSFLDKEQIEKIKQLILEKKYTK